MNTSTGDPEKFLTTQHERDKETGLDYRGARFYDSDIARFLSLDPLAKEFPAWSAYNYVMGNPISLIDPTGRSPEGTGDDKKKKPEDQETLPSLDPKKGGDLPELIATATKQEGASSVGPELDLEAYNARTMALYSGNTSTILGIIGAGMETVGKNRSINLYQQGYRQGLNGTYQLVGRNASLFLNMPAKSHTLPMTTLGKLGKLAGNTGNIISGGVMAYETYDYFYNPNTNLSGARYGYHLGTFGASLGVGAAIGGPPGAVAGAAVGVVSTAAEITYDEAVKPVAKDIQRSYNNFNNQLINNWLRFR